MGRAARTRDRDRPTLGGGSRLLSYHGFAAGLALALCTTWLALNAGISPTLSTILALLPLSAFCLVLERHLPYSEHWRPGRRTAGIDLSHSLIWPLLLTPRVQSLCLVLVVWLAEHDAITAPLHLWPSQLPFALEVMLAILLADFIAYWFHRLLHWRRTGWRIHATHHSSTHLHFLAAGRSHPFNFLFFGIESFVLLALGVPPEVLAMVSTAKGTIGLLQHANADLRPGWLSQILATNEVHFWHHSVRRQESDRNFGNITMVWDQVFGTFFRPAELSPRIEVGIANARVPESFLAHLLLPFRLQRYELDAPE